MLVSVGLDYCILNPCFSIVSICKGLMDALENVAGASSSSVFCEVISAGASEGAFLEVSTAIPAIEGAGTGAINDSVKKLKFEAPD